MAKTGRPDGAIEWLEKDNLTRIEGWARDGLTDKQIANDKIGIAENTFCAWKNKHSEILEALKKGKAPVDIEVENALLKRALGYEYEEVTTEKRELPDGKIEKHIKKVTKAVIPDTTAQIFWLKNRRPDKWRDKQIIENQGDGMLADLIEGLKDKNKDEGQEE